MTPKQFIRYTKWLDKNNLAICDGSTMEPQGMFDIIQTIVTIGGVMGLFGLIWYKIRNIL